jgi:hypothetical protein
VRHIQEKRPRLVAIDEIDRVLGIRLRELRLIVRIDHFVDDLVVLDHRELRIALFAVRFLFRVGPLGMMWPHIVRIG